MSTPKVNVTLTAKDLVSPDIANIRSRLDALGAKANIKLTASQITGNNFSAIQAGIASLRGETQATSSNLGMLSGLLTGLGAGVALMGVQLATQSFQALTSSIAQAAKTQTQFIAASSDIGTNLGVPLQTAKKLNSELQEEVSKTAAALPGTTQDYNVVLQAISGTLASQFKGQPDAFKQVALDITKRTGVLASIRGANPAQAGSTMNRFIAGTMSMGEASLNDIFQKNPQLTAAINSESAKLGVDVKKWKTLQTSTRLAIVQAALRISTPDSLIAEFDGTVESLWQTWNTKLFDPQIGLLGMLRKVKSKGNRTVLDSVQGLFQAIDGLSKLGKLGFDPLTPIITFIDWLSDLTNGFHQLVSVPGKDVANKLSTGLSGVLNKLAPNIAAGLNNVIKLTNLAYSKIDHQLLGKYLWKGLLHTLKGLVDVLAHLDWGQIGLLLWNSCKAGIEILIGFIKDALIDIGYAIKSGFQSTVSQVTGDFGKVTGITPTTTQDAIGSAARIVGGIAGTIAPNNPAIKIGQEALKIFTPKPTTPLAIPGTTDTKTSVNKVFAPKVSISPQASISSPTEIAQSVVDALSQMYQSYEAGQLA